MDTHLALHNRHTGESLRLRRVRDRHQIVLELEGLVPPHGDGPPMHVHLDQAEEGLVRSGVLAATVGGRTVSVGPGGTAQIPQGQPHRFWNAGDEPLVFTGRAVPAGDLDRYLQAVFTVLNAGEKGRPSFFHMAHVLYRHRRTQRLAAGPAWAQRILLGSAVAIGRLVGAYPTSGWPGAPQSCPGAPEVTTIGHERGVA